MLKRYLFFPSIWAFVLFFWALPALADTIVDTAWVRTYNGQGDSSDQATAIAVDGSGNVYVTGRSVSSGTDWDYATIKYDPDGDTAWLRRYDGPANSVDWALAIAIDGSGNVYVTGKSYSSGTDFDYATIKYYPDGDTAWLRRYDGPGNSVDYASAIAVDGSGNVYVTGGIQVSGSGGDYATIKYDSDGDTVWVRTYSGSGNSDDVASAIAVDGSGNVYVTGGSNVSGYYYDYATIKYYPNGDIAWVRRYGSGSTYTGAYAIAVDGSGNVYVTGYSAGSGTGTDYATIKYYPNGDTAWLRRYDGPANSWDGAFAIAVDDSDNVYVTGYSYDSLTSNDYATIKYYPDGDTAWIIRYNGSGNGSDGASAIAVDGSGNVYVTGWSYSSGTDWDYATIKYAQFPFSPNRFSLLSPTNNDTVQSTVTFSWQFTGDPDPNDTLHYALYLSRSSVFNPDSVIVYDSLIDTTLTDSLAIKSWYWKVKAYDKWGELRWSNQTWSFYAFSQGDANGDGVINIADVVYLINFLFIDGPAPVPIQAGDVNCNGYITAADIVYLINYLFIGGPPPSC